MQLNSISLIDRTLSRATIPSQSGPGSDGNKGLLCILQGSSITGTSPTDCLLLYSGNSLQLVYSTAPADWETEYYYF